MHDANDKPCQHKQDTGTNHHLANTFIQSRPVPHLRYGTLPCGSNKEPNESIRGTLHRNTDRQ
jgi:hypothetical protein